MSTVISIELKFKKGINGILLRKIMLNIGIKTTKEIPSKIVTNKIPKKSSQNLDISSFEKITFISLIKSININNQI